MTELLRFSTCGSVDDGKSTLLGRLLFESRQVFDDQLAAAGVDSRRYGTVGNDIDLALLVDGLQAERDQRITIDVAYRFFATPVRRFIAADTPGHEQYTRNMATGASTADLAVLLVDARKGILTQTRRHSRIVSMLGVRHVVLAVNKMDLVDWRIDVFERTVHDFRVFAGDLGFSTIDAIPLSALSGENVVHRGESGAWYRGLPLLKYLETIVVGEADKRVPFRMPVQLVLRSDSGVRAFAGRVATASIRVGDRIRVSPRGTESTVKSISIFAGDLPEAAQGQSIALTLSDEIDVSRGDVIGSAAAPIPVAQEFEARILWLSEKSLVVGRPYLLRIHTRQVGATIVEIGHRIDVNSGEYVPSASFQLNDVGVAILSTDAPIPFEAYDLCRSLGAFILIDRISNDTVGAGMILFAVRRAKNHLRTERHRVQSVKRAAIKHQKASCVWLTGLRGAGKSTIAHHLDHRLHSEGRHSFVLDYDDLRTGLNRDLGSAADDEIENARRIAETAKLMVEAGLIAIVASVSPSRAEREFARSLFDADSFIEVYLDSPFEICRERMANDFDDKGNQGHQATDADSIKYEVPKRPDVHVQTDRQDPEECVSLILATLQY